MLNDGWLTLLIILGVIMVVILLYYACLWRALRQDSRTATAILREPLTRNVSITTDITSVSVEP